MKLTRKRVEVVLEQASELCRLAEEFMRYYMGYFCETVLIDDSWKLYYMYNIACSCHPEYEKQEIPMEEFYIWLDLKREEKINLNAQNRQTESNP